MYNDLYNRPFTTACVQAVAVSLIFYHPVHILSGRGLIFRNGVIPTRAFLQIPLENESAPVQAEESPPAERPAAGLPAGRRNPPGGKSSLILG